MYHESTWPWCILGTPVPFHANPSRYRPSFSPSPPYSPELIRESLGGTWSPSSIGGFCVSGFPFESSVQSLSNGCVLSLNLDPFPFFSLSSFLFFLSLNLYHVSILQFDYNLPSSAHPCPPPHQPRHIGHGTVPLCPPSAPCFYFLSPSVYLSRVALIPYSHPPAFEDFRLTPRSGFSLTPPSFFSDESSKLRPF